MTDSQHTPPSALPAIGPPILERKLKPDGTWREYQCELLHLDRSLAVVRFVMAKGGTIFGTPIEVPPGSVSHGWFWKRRPYNLYRMRRADGSLIAHRFDAVSGVKLSPEAVEYRDCVLDWWVAPDGEIIEEDRDELDDLVASGGISARDLSAARDAARQVLGLYRHIIDDVEALERRLALPL